MSRITKIHFIIKNDYLGFIWACDRAEALINIDYINDEETVTAREHVNTFDITKVTCKRCLRHRDYKTAVLEQTNKMDYPLFASLFDKKQGKLKTI